MKVAHLIFDLDDTLYPSSSGMNKAIAHNMIAFVAEFLHVPYEQAVKIRLERLCHFGSTLEWLMSEGLTDAEPYFAAVHPENETDGLVKAPGLRPFLQSLHIPMTILTNAPSEHAERVLKFLEVRDLFDSITDIRDCGLKGKPYAVAFETALKRAGGTVQDSLFIDDQKKYTAGYENVGGVAVQVGSGGGAYQTAVLPDASKTTGVVKGRTYHLDSIYNLPDLLHRLGDLV